MRASKCGPSTGLAVPVERFASPQLPWSQKFCVAKFGVEHWCAGTWLIGLHGWAAAITPDERRHYSAFIAALIASR